MTENAKESMELVTRKALNYVITMVIRSKSTCVLTMTGAAYIHVRHVFLLVSRAVSYTGRHTMASFTYIIISE